ncbi:MAG: GTP-binding protein [Promethearchaeota archaeon]|nr:MAG: GTP-binding protein [Candidatus Lokiarchaeota archaeon]
MLTKTISYDAIFKVVIFGDAGCGKTTLMQRFMTGRFMPGSTMTIGVDFESKCLEVGGNRVKLMLWDFGGEERFRFIFPQYIAGAMGGILLFDITDYSSFSHITSWLSIMNGAKDRFPIILLGGKLDLEDMREVSYEEGLKMANSMGIERYFECSSKTGKNANKSFEELTKLMIDRM